MSLSTHLIRTVTIAASLAIGAGVADAAPPPINGSLPDELREAQSIWIPKAHAWIVDGIQVGTTAGTDAAGALKNQYGFVAAFRADLASSVISDALESRYTGANLSPSVAPSISSDGTVTADSYAFYQLDPHGKQTELIGVAKCEPASGIQVGHDMILCQAGVQAHLEDGLTVGVTRAGLAVSIENDGYRILGPSRDGWLAISPANTFGRVEPHLVRLSALGHRWQEKEDLGVLTRLAGIRIHEPTSPVLVDVDFESPSAYSDFFQIDFLGDPVSVFAPSTDLVLVSQGRGCLEPKRRWLFSSERPCYRQAHAYEGISARQATVLEAGGISWLLTERAPGDIATLHWAIHDLGTIQSAATLGASGESNPATVVRSARSAYAFDRLGPSYDAGLQQWNAAVPAWWASLATPALDPDRP